MQGWEIAMVVLLAVALGAILPLIVQLYGTLHVLRTVAEKSAKDVEQAVGAIHRTAERVDKLGAALEKDGKMAEIVDGLTAAAQVMTQVRGTLSVAGPIAAAVVPAVAAAVKAWRGGMEADSPPAAEPHAHGHSHHEKKEAAG